MLFNQGHIGLTVQRFCLGKHGNLLSVTRPLLCPRRVTTRFVLAITVTVAMVLVVGVPTAVGYSHSPPMDLAQESQVKGIEASSGVRAPAVQGDGVFGTATAMAGVRVAVGAPGETAAGLNYAGNAYVFNTKTSAVTDLSSPNAQFEGNFGSSIAISGTTVVVGAPDENVSGQASAGRAYVFSATTGHLIQTLSSPNSQADGKFGSSVAVAGGRVLVGAPDETVSALTDAGRAYVFSASKGHLIATLTSANAQSDGKFGTAVGISGATVIVGAPGETVSGHVGAGHAYVLKATSGALLETLSSPNVANDVSYSTGGFGSSVAISGSTAVVGAPLEPATVGQLAGNAYVFKATTGALLSTLTNPDPQIGGKFGFSVAISGKTAIVGAWGNYVSGDEQAGNASIFHATSGSLIVTITSASPQVHGDFGWSVAISGSKAAVGASNEVSSGDPSAGNVYVVKATTGALVSTLSSP